MSNKQKTFQKLFELCQEKKSKDEAFEYFMHELLNWSSDTEENLSLKNNITYGKLYDNPYTKNFGENPKNGFGFAVNGNKHFPIATFMNDLEGIPIPKNIKEFYPELKQSEFDSILRLTTLIFLLFENE